MPIGFVIAMHFLIYFRDLPLGSHDEGDWAVETLTLGVGLSAIRCLVLGEFLIPAAFRFWNLNFHLYYELLLYYCRALLFIFTTFAATVFEFFL